MSALRAKPRQDTEKIDTNQNGLAAAKDGSSVEEDKIDEASTSSSACSVVPRFVANMTCLFVLFMTMVVYNVGVLRTLERRFGLQSSQTGLMMAMNDVSHIIVVVFIGYLGRKAHKPKVLSISVLFSTVAGLMMASPHFIFPKTESLISMNATDETDKLLCAPSYTIQNDTDNDKNVCNSDNSLDAASDEYHAYLIFMAAQFLNGIGGSGLTTLGIAYIDENSSKSKSSMYVGIVMGCLSFGPIGGFMLSALCLLIPESPWSPDNTDPTNPGFIGAWWLGYVFCAVAIAISAIPMWFFPKHVLLPKSAGRESIADLNLSRIDTIKHEFKDFLPSLLRMVTNKAYVVMLSATILAVYIVNGIYINMPRYIEIHFLQPAFVASIVVGCVSAFASVIGGFLGGAIMSRMKLTPPGGVRLMIFSLSVGCLGIVISMVLGCPQVKMAGDWDQNDMLSVDSPTCNDNCGCTTEKGTYRPVCGSDNLTYFSPCHAGCKLGINGTYDNCGCLGQNGPVREGVCNEPCNLLIPYAVSLFITSVLSAVGHVPSTIVQLRIVGEDMRSFALGLSSFAVNLLGFIPGPVLFGAIVDSTCLLWQKTCENTGACLLYDVTRFRLLTHGITLVFLFGGLLLTIVLYLIVRKMKFSYEKCEEIDIKKERTDDFPHEMHALMNVTEKHEAKL